MNVKRIAQQIAIAVCLILAACDGTCDSDNIRACAYACREQNERMSEWSKGHCTCTAREGTDR